MKTMKYKRYAARIEYSREVMNDELQKKKSAKSLTKFMPTINNGLKKSTMKSQKAGRPEINNFRVKS